MSKLLRVGAVAAAITSGVVLSLSAAAPAHASPRRDATPTVRVLANGLNNPKHITLGPGGVYVAESGTGGSSCVTIAGVSYCEGETGSVALVSPFGTVSLLSGLPSVNQSDEGVAGPAAVTFSGGKLAVLFQDTAVNSDGSTAVQGPGSDIFGKVLRASPFSGSSGWSVTADLAAFAAAHPQDPSTLGGAPGAETPYDSDPYAIVPYQGGYAIADGAANDVLWLSPGGALSILARLPTVPIPFAGTTINAQAVPTSLAVGPDGALYIGTLPGFPASPGTASIYRLVPGQAPTVAASGLTTVTDIAFDHEGRLLAVEYSTGGLASAGSPGALARVDLSTGTVTTLPVSGLVQPTGLAVGCGDTVFMTNNGNTPGQGEILKITGLG